MEFTCHLPVGGFDGLLVGTALDAQQTVQILRIGADDQTGAAGLGGGRRGHAGSLGLQDGCTVTAEGGGLVERSDGGLRVGMGASENGHSLLLG